MKEEEKITGFSLTREWFEWAFDNHTKINPSHSAVYFFHVYLWNSLGGKKEFDSPNGQAMEGCGIRCIKSYTKTFNELVEFGFIRLVQAGSNKWKAKVVSLIKSKNKNEGTLAKSINISKKTTVKETETQEPAPKAGNKKEPKFVIPDFQDVEIYFGLQKSTRQNAEKFFDYYTSNDWKVGRNPMKDWYASARNWIKRDLDFSNNSKHTKNGNNSNSTPDESLDFYENLHFGKERAERANTQRTQ